MINFHLEKISDLWTTLCTSFTGVRHLVNTMIVDCSTEALISSLQESIKQLTIANEEKHASLEYAKAEVRELKEVMESVSINKSSILFFV